MEARTENRPPGMPGAVPDIDSERAATQSDNQNNRAGSDILQAPRVSLSAFMRGALAEIARQHGEARPRPRRRYVKPPAPDLTGLPDLPLLDRIAFAAFHAKPLRIDGLDLLRLYDFDLPFWLGDAGLIVAADVLVGRYIRNAFQAANMRPPAIMVEASHG